MPKIKLEGMEKLQVKLKKNVQMSDVKRVVRKNGSELQKKAQKNAPVGTPQSTGIPGYVAEYAAYVEYGTRYMNAQPYLKPAFNEQKEKFKQDMRKLAR